MNAQPSRLLCIDLQIDAVPGREPDAAAIFGARQLLGLGRRLGWTIAHARRRSQVVIRARTGAQAGVNPLMSEQVFFHNDRSIADSQGLAALLHSWRNETVLVAAFDQLSLLSCLLACHEHGPRLVMIEDVPPLQLSSDTPETREFRSTAKRLSAGAVTIGGLIAEANRRQGIRAAPLQPVGERPRGMQV
jgi:hypothetical protein